MHKLVLALALVLVAGESVKLARTHEVGKKSDYTVKVDVPDLLTIESEMTFETKKVEDKLITVLAKAGKQTMTMSGGVPVSEPADFGEITIEPSGMPRGFLPKDESVPPFLVLLLSYLPKGEFEVGKAVDLTWKQADSGELTGTMTLEKVDERDGKKIAVFKTSREYWPKDDSHSGTLKGTLEFDCADASLVRAIIDLHIQELDAKVKIDRK